MGVFLQTVIVQKNNMEAVRAGIQKVEASCPDMSINSLECVYRGNDKGICVVMNEHSTGYEMLAERLSQELHMPVMLLYIYDSDAWGYFYCEDGTIKDLFTVCPEDASFIESALNIQAQDITPKQYKDSAQFIAKRFNINESEIINYYKIWTDELIEDEQAAYEDDECTYGDCWQMADFMRRLGFPFPEDDVTEDIQATGSASNQNIAVIQNNINTSWEAEKNKKNFDYAPAAAHAGAFDYEYINFLLKQYGSKLKDIIRLMECGGYRQARDELTRRIDDVKNNCNSEKERKFLSGLYLLRGSCSRNIGNSWQAGKDLDAAYELEPENVYILRQRISNGTSKERIKREINDLNTLMRLDGKNYDYYLVERAWGYYRFEEMEAARRDLMEAKIRCNSNDNIDFVVLSERLGV